MGVSGLRRLLEDVVYEANLPTMAWEHWEEHKRPLRVGIDSSIWLVSVEHISKAHPKADPLKILLHKLFRLLASPLAPLFVFDGPLRPGNKRGKAIDTRTPVVNERRFREMARALGFQCWTAPGEAEAELSFLAGEGRLDAVVTEDSDALLFGAPLVLAKPRMRGEKKLPPDDFKVYSLAAIKERYEVDCKGLILVGLMGGADYDTIGIEKCTVGMALSIARYGFGNVLIDGYIKHSAAYFADPFLPAWRKQIKDVFRFNPDKILGSRKYPSVARNIFDNFPDVKVIDMHVRPITSRSHGQRWAGFDRGKEAEARVPQTAKLSEDVFGWREGILLEKLRRNVWLGATVRSLAQEIESPGAWDAACQSLKLVPPTASAAQSTSASAASSSSARVTDYFGTSRPKPSTPQKAAKRTSQPLGASSHQPSSGGPSSSATAAAQFRSSQPLLTKITLMRTRNGKSEYRVVVNPTRFVVETLDGLGIPREDVKDFVNPLPKPAAERTVVEALEDDGDEEAIALWDGAPVVSVEDPFRPFLVWLPERIIALTHAHLVEAFRGDGALVEPGKDGKTRPVREPRKGKAKAVPAVESSPIEIEQRLQQTGLAGWLAGESRPAKRRKAKTIEVIDLSSSQPQMESADEDEGTEGETDDEGDDVVCLSPVRRPVPLGPDSSFLNAAFTTKRALSPASLPSSSRTVRPHVETDGESSPARPTPAKVPRTQPPRATPTAIGPESSVGDGVEPSSDPFKEDEIAYADVDLSWVGSAPAEDAMQDDNKEGDDDGQFDWIPLTISQETRLLAS